jgi:hypothetical protein
MQTAASRILTPGPLSKEQESRRKMLPPIPAAQRIKRDVAAAKREAAEHPPRKA